MKLSKKALWIIGTLITSAIAGIFFYLNIHNSSATTFAVILAGVALYFLFVLESSPEMDLTPFNLYLNITANYFTLRQIKTGLFPRK